MRPSHKSRNRNRHRSSGGGGGSSGGNPLNRVYESNGPDVKVRGTAQTVADKYLQLGRDAHSSGDIVMAESYYQHAEHYLRIIAAAQAYNQQVQQQYRRPEEEFDDEELDDIPETAVVEQRGTAAAQGVEPEGVGDQPMIQGDGERPPQQQQQNRQQRDQREPREQSGQPYQSRDRNRSRWQERRDQNRDQPREGGEQRTYTQPRGDDQPRVTEPAPPALAAADAEQAEGQWEAPSFLRRPSAAPAPAAEAVAEGVATETAAAPPPKRRYERKPRKEAAAEAAPPAEPAEADPAAD